jgi:membrane-bound metal-dependent hydrolase YbcI (DUF457 family)
MLGKSHLVVGAAGWLALGPAIAAGVGHPLGLAEIGTGAVIASGAAMLPDLDHPQATLSRSLGPVSQTFSRGFSKALGGHRNGSHSLLFVLFLGLILHFALATTSGPWIALGISFVASLLFFRTLTEARPLVGMILAAVSATVLVTISPQMDWIFFAVIIGVLLHDFGDFLTSEGVPPLWPVSKKRVALPIISRTGNGTEQAIAALAGVAAAILFIVLVSAPSFAADNSAAPNSPAENKAKIRPIHY